MDHHAKIMEQGRGVVTAFTEFAKLCDNAGPEEFMELNILMTRIQGQCNQVLSLIQDTFIEAPPVRRNELRSLLRELAEVSEHAKRAHTILLISIYGNETVQIVEDLAALMTQDEED